MTNFRKLAPALVGALALSFGAAAVGFAQDAGAPPAGADAGHRHWDPAAMKAKWEARRAEHIKTMHDALSIRPDQEAAFQAFTASMGHGDHMGGHMGHMGDHKGHMDGHMGAGEHPAMTTPERLDRMEKRMGERQAMFEKHAAAVKTFYAALSPEQQHTFDALAKMRGHGGRGGGMGHHHMGGGMHGGGGMGGQEG